MTIEEFKIEIPYWNNLELIRYKTGNALEIKAIGEEIKYRIKNSKSIYKEIKIETRK